MLNIGTLGVNRMHSTDLSGSRAGEDRLSEFVISTTLAVEPAVLWRHAVSPSGVNREFQPLLRMTFPSDISDLTAAWQPGERLCRSWLLLAGFVPIDYDDLVFEEVEPGQRFLERSSLLSQRVWEHERLIEPALGGSRVTDHVRFEPRLPWLAGVYRLVFAAVFRWRHHNLRDLFGEVKGPTHR
jgi:hypothetical protein